MKRNIKRTFSLTKGFGFMFDKTVVSYGRREFITKKIIILCFAIGWCEMKSTFDSKL